MWFFVLLLDMADLRGWEKETDLHILRNIRQSSFPFWQAEEFELWINCHGTTRVLHQVYWILLGGPISISLTHRSTSSNGDRMFSLKTQKVLERGPIYLTFRREVYWRVTPHSSLLVSPLVYFKTQTFPKELVSPTLSQPVVCDWICCP